MIDEDHDHQTVDPERVVDNGETSSEPDQDPPARPRPERRKACKGKCARSLARDEITTESLPGSVSVPMVARILRDCKSGASKELSPAQVCLKESCFSRQLDLRADRLH
jgi:hypothetical protein